MAVITKKPKSYAMTPQLKAGAIAEEVIDTFLRQLPQTVSLQSVKDDREYQRIDVDFIWTTNTARYKVEVKGDSQDNTGNIFFETMSNVERDKKGCMLITEADLLFYYFVNTYKLYTFRMSEYRDWVLSNKQKYGFREKVTSTRGDNSSQVLYTSTGLLIPRRVIEQDLKSVVVNNLTPFVVKYFPSMRKTLGR